MKATFSPPEPELMTQADVRTRLLTAAEKLFAQHGPAATSIRDLAREAQVNVAAINYYFGSKENLYLETLRQAFRASREVMPRFDALAQEAQATGTVEAAHTALRLYIEEFMKSLFVSDESDRHMRLMAREMSDPTPALDAVIDEFIEPKSNILKQLVAQARPDLDPETEVPFYALSIVGQCLHYRLTQPVILRLMKREKMTSEMLDQISVHIAAFSLAALSR
ncbi:MAG: CerR family C-terminal domain-containing protein [Blastocatellia bacterium]|nr:CerR family C-terminal domain-containing protein [Blastocatellia bacterium]